MQICTALGWAGLGRGIVCGVLQGCLQAYCRSWTGMMGPWDASKRVGVDNCCKAQSSPRKSWRS